MVLPIGPNKRELNHLMRWQAKERERSRENSLEEAIRQSNPSRNGHDETNTAYVFVLLDISAVSSPIPNGMTAAERHNPLDSVNESNAPYNSRGIERVVENTNDGLFGRIAGKIYDTIANTLGYAVDIAGKAVSLIPQPARRGLIATGLIAPLLATACLGSGTKEAYNANPTPQSTPTATSVPATATSAPKSTYELALERLNPQISQTARDFVKKLAEYNNSVGNMEELHKTYAGLERIIDVVERHPKIVNGLNQFGTDALALLIADNHGVVDMDKYWFLTNATALQAQDFFYVGNEIMWDGRFKNEIKGPAIDKKFDEKEREITNFRLRKQIEWQGKWSTPLEYEDAVGEYGRKQRASNAVRWRVLPQRLFVDDIVNGGTLVSYSTFDSNTWLVVASYNNEHSEEVRAEILARLNDPEKYTWDESLVRERYVGWEKAAPHFAPIYKKADEYYRIILLEGTPYEKVALLVTVSAREPKGHDLGTSLYPLWVSLVGASGGVGRAQIIHPEGHETGDPQYMFTLSKATEQKLNGVFVYGIDDLTRLLFLSEEDKKNPKYLSVDGLFGVYSNIDALRANGTKELSVLTPGWRIVEIPVPK